MDTSAPTIEQINKLDTTDSLIKCLNEHINFTEKTLQALRNEEVNGSALLQSSQEDLKEWEVPGGLAKNIIGLIKELKKKRKAEEEPLHGSQASGKSTRVLQLQDQLNNKGFDCIYASFEHVNMNNLDLFWQTLGITLQRNAPELFGPLKSLQIKSANDFLNTFHRTQWKSLNTVILFDEFDMLYNATEGVLASCLTTLRGIKASKQDYAICSIIAIGPFSIMHLNSNNLTTSPFNVNEPFQNPNFILEQVQHAGLVCLCGHAIYRKLLPEIGVHLSYDSWQRFATFLLGNAILEYPTFMRMKDALLNENSVDSMKLF
ncbi:transcriptional regulator [Gigaspora margarita]|uniref:Transcriptional regulator n=1 Tax=Gigaspora margarita TaxID=4874 RepID=A0A8H3X6P0_GIGMA|nr:transcriptional regulator [Gigaspora margarita]